jgi:hypothetical protein
MLQDYSTSKDDAKNPPKLFFVVIETYLHTKNCLGVLIETNLHPKNCLGAPTETRSQSKKSFGPLIETHLHMPNTFSSLLRPICAPKTLFRVQRRGL